MSAQVVVVGGGPAGLSAAIQAASRNKQVLVVSGPMEDIPLWRSPRVDNYPGMPGVTGRALLEAFDRQAQALGVERRTGKVLNILPMGDSFTLGIGQDVEEAGAVVLATGARVAEGIPGEERLLGRGVSYCATCDGMFYRGKRVVVVGQSAQAPQEAAYLRSIGCDVVYVSARRPADLPENMPFLPIRTTVELLGQEKLAGVQLGGIVIPCDGAFLLRSSVALSGLLPGLTLEEGYLAVDRRQRTNLPGVFAAGDCTGQPHQIAKAVGEGLVAGLSAAEYLDQHHKH